LLVLDSNQTNVEKSARNIKKAKVTTVASGANGLKLRIDVLLPYDPNIYQSLGGSILPSILPFDTQNKQLATIPDYQLPVSSPATPIIPDFDPNRINTFEQYFCFYALLLLGALNEDRNSVITIQPRPNNLDKPEIKIRLTLGLNAVVFSLGGSFVNSFGRETLFSLARWEMRISFPMMTNS